MFITVTCLCEILSSSKWSEIQRSSWSLPLYHHDLEKKGHKQNPLQGQQQTFYLCSNELLKFSKGWMIEITPVPVKHMCTHSHTPRTGNNKPRTETSDLNIHHLSVCLWGPFRLKESHKNRFDVNPWLDVGIEGSDIVKNAAVWHKHTPEKCYTWNLCKCCYIRFFISFLLLICGDTFFSWTR